jgi:hypothetical protein
VLKYIDNINELEVEEAKYIKQYKANDNNVGYNLRVDCARNNGVK